MSDMTHRHLRHKLQSVSRRLDELEEANNKLQKSEDELLDIQDKIIQAEGSNSSLLADVEALRKRLLKIQGKDEEVRKAEDLCRTVREKLEEEENLTKELKAEIEHLQRRLAELEKLEEAFGKSKSDCSQLCLSLNEEKNLTKKLSTEMESLKTRLKEMEASEMKLDKAEQALTAELDKLKGFYQAFENEHKMITEKQREDEKIILKLTEKLEEQKNRLGMAVDPSRADFMRSRIEDELSSTGILSGRKKSLDYNMGLLNKSENQKNSGLAGSQEEDNKVKELTQEVERLKNRLKQLEIVENDLKSSESKNDELHEKFQMERKRARQLSEQVEQLRTQLCSKGGVGGNVASNVDKQGNGSVNICPGSLAKHLENGKAENEEFGKGSFRQEKPKYRSAVSTAEPISPKHRNRELSPQHKRETKLRTKELSNSEESSAITVKRALSPAHKSRRTPKTPNSLFSSDNGIKETSRGIEEKTYKGATYSSVNTPSSDIKKVSVLSRYPPAANDHKPLRTAHRQSEGERNKSRMEKFSKLYAGSDSESNNSDVVPESSVSALEKDTKPASDQELTEQVQDPVFVTSKLSKANESFKANRSNVNQLLPNDQGSEGHSSASETESTGSRPSEPETVNEMTTTTSSSRTPTSRYPRYSHVKDSHSEGSSSRSSFDEELHSRTSVPEGGISASSVIEIQRVCSPREALRSKAVIKPAIIEIDRKEMMISDPFSANGKPKISTKPVLTSTSKMTSSITIYPNDPSSSRTSSRSSSVSSEPMSAKERHTSTSNFLIGPSSDHHGSVSIPYEISIPKSEITMQPSQEQDSGADYLNDSTSKSKLHNTSRIETSTSHIYHQRSNFSHQSPGTNSADLNNTESGLDSFTSWRNQRQRQRQSQEERLPDLRNVTVRSTWKNHGTTSAEDEKGGGRVAGRVIMDGGGSEDEAETTTTWRAYLATTVDSEDTVIHGPRLGGNKSAAKGAKPSPAEGANSGDHCPSPSHNQASWRQNLSSTNSLPLGSSSDRTGKTTTSRGEQWSARAQGSAAKTEGKTGASGSRLWSHRQAERH
ncbi:leucine zipper protein 1 isoform X2 [Dunckerocampus dactyliophorus]|uniref:leucine zipper protein 1 isoform X2 n=1 Tax=Dunckerocampus dactyliophorus TaxID=161453 RepID=UPI00240722F0|nr:leucine zipper protein 1 isoform X2 [Dunckerocampus dactyliophorus]